MFNNRRWVKQLREEHAGKAPHATTMTTEQLEIRELKKQVERLELEKEILKKASALLMTDPMKYSRLSRDWVRQ